MIYFSYFGNWRNFPKDVEQVAVCNNPPRDWKGGLLKEFAPKMDLFYAFKSGKMYNGKQLSLEEFLDYYKEYLDSLNKNLFNIKQDVILLCYEKNNEECHRSVLMKKLIDMGVRCRELGISQKYNDLKS